MCPLLLVLSLALLLPARADRYHPERAARPAAAGSSRAATPDAAERGAAYWYSEAFAAIDERLTEPTYDDVAKNVIMFLGDGLSVPTLAPARTLRGQLAGRTGEEERLVFEHFPITGLAKTYCLDAQIPDSACTATAYLCGVKVNRGTLGVNGNVLRWDCPASTDTATHLESIAAWALADGRSVGIVTSTRVTHASPAAAYARTANRGWENDGEVRAAGYDPAQCPDIADQLINSYPGNQFKVILGGGRREFRPNTTRDEENASGLRWDGRDLIEEWHTQREEAGDLHAYAWNRTQLLDAIANPPDYLLGLFEASHLRYEAEVREANLDKPTLAELTEAAIRVLSKNPRGFFLFVEGGRIDHAHHDTRPALALYETLALDEAVARADSLLPLASSLLVLTADHSHVMAFNGYSRRGNDILGASDALGDDSVPYMTLSYTNGPGYRDHVDGKRVDVTHDSNFQALRWRTHTDVPLDSETHGGDDVAVFARGPAQALFTGLYEQSQLPHLMAHAACLGPAAERRDACNGSVMLSTSVLALLLSVVAALVH
ncbi:membrane-bound alkaline phosphatase-like [Cydia pomonella]|uniref:membrane-bound alkaline phosphatase-like n=1 Tax=Cydia pomonella TaxID=82600 RepID=UPI002ADD6668|nr:membrane-bound alkaline phosphatase-like [Cydia pomonella]